MKAPRRISGCGCALFLAVCVAVLLPASSLAAISPAPAWTLGQSTLPTTLVPGSSATKYGEGQAEASNPKIKLTATNVGGASFGTATIHDVLPAGIVVAPENSPRWKSRSSYPPAVPEENTIKRGQCAVLNQEVTCEVPFAIQPGISVVAYIPVEVITSGPVSLTNEVVVEGLGGSTIKQANTVAVGDNPGPFGFGALSEEGVQGGAFDQSGKAAQAGTHPFIVQLTTKVKTISPGTLTEVRPLEPLRSLSLSLPAGMVVNPLAAATRCTRFQFEIGEERCPASSQVGVIIYDLVGGAENNATPLYALVPEPGVPAELGFAITGATVSIRGGLSGDFRLTAGSSELLSRYPIDGIIAQLWGVPSDERHDSLRRSVIKGEHCEFGCGSPRDPAPFLTMPSACSQSMNLEASALSWLGSSVSRSELFRAGDGLAQSVVGCEGLGFSPTATVTPTTEVPDSPSGLAFDLRVPQSEALGGSASSTLKRVSVQLPPGVAVNPSAVNGLAACSQGQIELGGTSPAECPPASKVGTAEISTPLLSTPLNGTVYLAEQKNNPFGSLLALYLAVEGEGVVIKLAGKVDVNPSTGQVTTTFDDNPQLPFEDLKVNLNSGPRAALVTPSQCGVYTARTELTPWSGMSPVIVNSPITISQGCTTGRFNPGFAAGSVNPSAGRYSSFNLRATREDGEQNLLRIGATLPKGLLAKLAGVALCPDTQAATGSCPSSSQVGTVASGVGSGPLPLYLPQATKAPTAVYLAGPYRGGPYSLVVKVPAQAGPFDLGTIAVRAVLKVDPFTSQVTAESDALPQILEGIPVAYRDVRVEMTRPEFVRNPTSCDSMSVLSTLVSSAGAIADPSSPFQVAGCSSLAFKPSLKLSLKGSTTRTGHPGLKAVLTYPEKGNFANIRRAQVNLPHSEFLDQSNLNRTCTRPVLLEGKCPKTTVYGKAKAWTPLLDNPLEGPVYLVGGFGYKLPALVAELGGQLRVLLVGKVDTGPNKGIRNTFEAVPDAPVSRFVLELKGGKKYSLLENSENLCKSPQQAVARFTGQNGAVKELHPRISVQCGKGRGKSGKRSGGKGA